MSDLNMKVAIQRERHQQACGASHRASQSVSLCNAMEESFRAAQQQALLAAGTADLQAHGPHGHTHLLFSQKASPFSGFRRALPESWSASRHSCKPPAEQLRWRVPLLSRTAAFRTLILSEFQKASLVPATTIQ